MFGRHSGSRDEPAILGVWTQVVDEEVGSTLHDRVIVGQQLAVACKEVLLPDVRRQPGTTRREHAPCRTVDRSGNAPEVGIVMRQPALAAIHLLGSLGTRHAEVANHREQRLLGLDKVTHHGGPVVHLGIDIDGVFGVPGGILFAIPHTLQVGRLTTRLRAADKQIAPILHHERNQVQIKLTVDS